MEEEEMAEANPENHGMSDLSEEEWAEEVARLDSRSAGKQIYVEIQWLFGSLSAIAFRFQVYERMIHILLQPQSPEGPADGHIGISLPKPYQGHYQKHASETGDIVLTMHYPIGKPPDVLDYSTVRLTTSLDFLQLVTTAEQKEDRLQ
jgi:hypothetical protein